MTAVFPHRLAAVAASVTRVVLGVLWLGEGITKYRAGFGQADILLVVGSTTKNPRVPEFYKFFTEHILGPGSGFFGILMPALELGLGILLIVGILPRWIAAAGSALLVSYWLADQLIVQYPIMILLAIPVIAWPLAAGTLSLPALRRRWRKPWG
ncbi:MauE/DoxX family redox-associated membrane protein [Mycetocola saprophilus]|uniref:MauE/DoxX family redox-associated membrane protein n=1 Tax=Mycetocola saprophilus TaxID=76636 RepID=UPI003BF3BDEE